MNIRSIIHAPRTPKAALLLAGCTLLPLAAAAQELTMWTFLNPAATSPRDVALKQIIEKFPDANPKGLGMYGWLRSTQMRRLRAPKPSVAYQKKK